MMRDRLSWLWSLSPTLTTNSLAFGAASFSSSVLCLLFELYVTPVFTSVYQIRDSDFYLSLVVFAIWNAINDPAFAWLIDNTTATGADRRLPAIKYGGPLWSLAFLIPWWPWTAVPGTWLVGLHFCVSICVFDSFLTYVLLVHCALLADLTTDNTLRNNYNNVGSLLGLAGGAAAAASYHIYDESNMRPFQLFCLTAAGISCLGFWWTGTRLDISRLEGVKKKKGGPAVGREGGDETSVVRWQQQGESPGLRSPGIRSRGSGLFAVDGGRAQAGDAEREVLLSKGFVDREEAAGARGSGQVGREPSGGKPGNAPTSSGGSGRELSFWGFSMQLATHGNFWLYVSMNFVENFNQLFDKSFFVFLDTKLLEPSMPRGAHGLVTALCLYLPRVMTQVLTPVADRFGTYHLMLWAAAFKVLAGGVILAAGVRAWPVWAMMFLGTRLAGTVWGFYNLSFSDVIDEDTLRNRRSESMSVSVHGVQALFVKPAQSLAPILGMALLPKGALKVKLEDMDPDQVSRITRAAFNLLWAVPIVCGVIQVTIWRAYRLHGTALKDMKERLREWEASLGDEQHKSSSTSSSLEYA